MYSIVSTAIIQGIRSIPVSVEADVSDGMPVFEMVGFLASEVKEARERVRTALRNSGFLLPPKRVTINFAPADIRKSGSGFDLPVALAVLAALGFVPGEALEKTFVIGEVGLNGKTQPTGGILPMVVEAKECGLKRCIVPEANRQEAMMAGGIEVCDVSCIEEMVCILNGEEKWDRPRPDRKERERKRRLSDFSDIHGQYFARRACETAVSGMHNLLMIGPPGAGKTMMAMRIPSILPPLRHDEQMELSKIYSVSGLISEREDFMEERPFRAPHHTVTAQAMSGGGVHPRPGEISLAHKGVLFLDELPEFRKDTLEVLRQPMEEKKVRLIRLKGECEYPADFMLVAAMNPCRCGYYPDPVKCRCNPASVERYLGRISSPLLDRIDICVEALRTEFRELTAVGPEENSAVIQQRVITVHHIQQERYRSEDFDYNSQIPAARIGEYCALTRGQQNMMEEIYGRLNLTARAYHKILKVARTLADMEGAEQIGDRHLNEAVCYRSLDKKIWAHT